MLTDTESYTVHIKTENIYSNIAKDTETIFDTWNHHLDGPSPKRKNKK